MNAARLGSLRKGAAAGVLAAALAGCAALRIDVDVYKGPLANHEDVQVRQYAALAVAARPVLAALRNRLEDREQKRLDPQQRDFLFSGDLHFTERDDFIVDSVGNRFKSEAARMINGALSFYHDTGSQDAGPALDAMKRSIAALEAADREYRVDPNIDHPLAAEAEKAGAGPRARALAISLARFLRGEDDKGYSLKNPSGREEKQVKAACDALVKAAKNLSRAEISRLKWSPGSLQCGASESANDIFDAMSQRPVVEEYSKAIFGQVRKDIVDRVTTISTAFLARRKEMREMWLQSLNLLDSLATRGGKDSQLRTAARVVSELTQPRNLACYFTGELDPDQNQQAVVRRGFNAVRTAAMLQILHRSPLTGTKRSWPNDSASDTVNSRKAIAEAAALYPLELTALLRHADALYMHGPTSTFSTCDALRSHREQTTSPGGRRFGLVRGLALDEEFDRIVASVSESLQEIAAGTAAGFEYGRLPDGLDTLTRRFLTAMSENDNDPRSKGAVAARRKLEEMLILWAERVLVTINNRALLPPVGTERGVDAQAREVAVLEAVGNSILVHADDLRRRDDHALRQERRAGAEERAVRQAFDITAAQALDNLMRNLRADVDRLSREAAVPRPDGGQTVEQAQQAVTEQSRLLREARTASGEAVNAKSTIFPLSPSKLDQRAAALNAAIKAEAGKLAAGKTADDVLAVIVKAVDDAYKAATATPADARSPWASRLKRTKDYLESNKAEYGKVTGKDGPDILLRLGGEFGRVAEQKLESVKALQREEGELRRTLAALKAREDARVKATDFAAVRDVLIGLRGDLLKKADAAGADSPRALLALLADTLRAQAQAVAGTDQAATDKRRVLALALRVVQDTAPPRAPVMTGAPPGGKRTQKDVMDDVLALLRMQRTQALAAGETPRAENFDKAIRRLYEDRGDLAYLRPTSAYLRSVYTTTAYQTASDVSWVNMLARNTGRAAGFSDPRGYDKEYRETLLQIDKRHWQNINTVTLAGGGKTNYVLTKDDVGNWYLKNYSSDPKDIIRSAQGLALFGLGKGLDMNLLRRAQLQRDLSAETDPTEKARLREDLREEEAKEGKAGNAALGRVYLRYREEYEGQTRKDAQDLLDSIATVPERLNASWTDGLSGSTKESMLASLKDKYAPGLSAVSEAQTSYDALTTALKAGDTVGLERKVALAAAEDRAQAILRALESMRRLRVRLQIAILGDDELVKKYRDAAAGAADTVAQAAYDNATKNRAQAAALAASWLGEFIAQKTARRLDTVDRLEKAVSIVGQAQ